MLDLARFLVGVALLALGPGWLLTHPLRRALARAERVVVALAVGVLASGVVLFRWNTWVEGRPGAPDGGLLLWILCGLASLAALALSLRDRGALRAAADGRRVAALLGLVALAPLPMVAVLIAPNGRLTPVDVERTQDEPLHQVLVGEFLRPGPVQVPWLAGHPMSPYEFLTPATQAAFVRAAGVDPMRLADRYLPVGLSALACATAFVLIRRLTSSDGAAGLGAASLAWAGDPSAIALFTSQLHSALAYVACACGVLLLHLGLDEDRAPPARRAALGLAAFAFGCVFQLKTTLFATLALAMVGLAAWRIVTSRRLDVLGTGVAMAVVMAVLGTEYVEAATASPLSFSPGRAYAMVLSELPAPWSALGASRLVALAVGLPLALVAALNLKLAGVPWAVARFRAGARPGAAATFLILAAAVGTVLMISVYAPANPGSLVPFWFAQHPLLLTGQTILGAGAAAWVGRAAGRMRALRWSGLAIPGVLSLVALPGLMGDDPLRFPLAEVRCGEWLFAHTDPADPVLIPEAALGVALYSLRPMVYVHVPIFEGDKPNEIAPAQFLEQILAAAHARRALVAGVFEEPDVRRVRELARRTGARFLYVAPPALLSVSPEEAFGAPVARCGGEGAIFEIAR